MEIPLRNLVCHAHHLAQTVLILQPTALLAFIIIGY
jgi:hypothetical protein